MNNDAIVWIVVAVVVLLALAFNPAEVLDTKFPVSVEYTPHGPTPV